MKTRKAKNDTLRNTLTIELQGCVNSILNMVYAVNFLRLRNKHSGTCNLAQKDAMFPDLQDLDFCQKQSDDIYCKILKFRET